MVLVAPAAALSATVLSTNGTPVPATSWSTTHADSKPKSSTCRAAAPMSPNDSSRLRIVGRKTPIAGGAICGPLSWVCHGDTSQLVELLEDSSDVRDRS